MTDLRNIANAVAVCVNDDTIVSVFASTGYTIGANLKQVPSYAEAVTGPAQIQALTFTDLKQLDGLNIQGTARAIYLRGELNGVVNPSSLGGDLVTFPDGTSWLVCKVLEQWPNWAKACIVLQSPEGNQ